MDLAYPEALAGPTLEAVPSCPVCGSDVVPLPLHRHGPFTVARCRVCTAQFLSPRLARGSMAALYSSMDYFRSVRGTCGYRDYAGEHDAIARTARRRLRVLRRFVPAGRLLEVGAGFGYFLEEARRAGFDVAAVDISSVAAAELGRRFPRVYLGELEATGWREEFDALVLFDTIEHLYDLPRFVHAAQAALRPHGILAFTTPDTASPWAQLLGRRWWSYKVPEHVVYFNDVSVARLLRDTFTVVYREPDYQFLTVQGMLARLPALSPSARERGMRLAARLGVGDVMVPVVNGMKLYVARRLERS